MNLQERRKKYIKELDDLRNMESGVRQQTRKLVDEQLKVIGRINLIDELIEEEKGSEET